MPWASTPWARSAVNTAWPLFSETSRSAERPPSSTATLPNSAALLTGLRCCCSILIFSHYPHFGNQVDTVHPGDSIRNLMDQCFQVGGAGATGIDNKIGMLGGDTGGT